jgi:RimJ/RimL family protein N-acetyltransferase
MPTTRRWATQPIISDERLALRPFRPLDAWDMVEWDQDWDTQRFFDFPPLPPYDEHLRHAWWVIRWFREAFLRGNAIAYVISDAESGQALGTVEFHHVDGTTAEISFMTVSTRRREGIASHALRLLCDEGRERFGITHVVLEHHPDNTGSAGVARRAGFTEVQRTPDCVRYQRRI